MLSQAAWDVSFTPAFAQARLRAAHGDLRNPDTSSKPITNLNFVVMSPLISASATWMGRNGEQYLDRRQNI
jgi:hypothetical protein